MNENALLYIRATQSFKVVAPFPAVSRNKHCESSIKV
jgi:hypothetical protein